MDENRLLKVFKIPSRKDRGTGRRNARWEDELNQIWRKPEGLLLDEAEDLQKSLEKLYLNSFCENSD
jgi:hypothetical protein